MRKRFYVRKQRGGTPTYQPRKKKHDFLKNWRLVKYYIKRKYNISETNLELMLYLYSEDVFTKDMFNEMANTINWDKNRFQELLEAGYIRKWRDGKKSRVATLYELTQSAKLMCSHTYKKLTGEEEISENKYRNEIFASDNFSDKIYRNLIKKMNSKTRGDSHSESTLP